MFSVSSEKRRNVAHLWRHALPPIAMKSSAWWRELQLAAAASAVVG
jgi:hypothetical protein